MLVCMCLPNKKEYGVVPLKSPYSYMSPTNYSVLYESDHIKNEPTPFPLNLSIRFCKNSMNGVWLVTVIRHVDGMNRR